MIFRGDKPDYEGRFGDYIPGLLQRAPIEDIYETVPTIEQEMVGPIRARERLERQGIAEEEWPTLLELSGDMDDTRAYILVAMGTQKRVLHVLNANLITLDAMTSQDGTDICVGPTLRQPDMQTPAIAQRLGEIASTN
jgi:hypothetical protein